MCYYALGQPRQQLHVLSFVCNCKQQTQNLSETTIKQYCCQSEQLFYSYRIVLVNYGSIIGSTIALRLTFQHKLYLPILQCNTLISEFCTLSQTYAIIQGYATIRVCKLFQVQYTMCKSVHTNLMKTQTTLVQGTSNVMRAPNVLHDLSCLVVFAYCYTILSSDYG